MKQLDVLIIIFLLGIIVYANSFQNDFTWDDEYLITNNTHVKSPSVKHALLFFKDNLGRYGQDENNFYRPLQELSYMIDYAVWGLNPVGFHFVNLILHILVVFLLYLVIEQIAGNRIIAFISSLIYMVHPLHVEAVTYIAGRADLLVTLFFILAFYLYLRQETLEDERKTYLFRLLSSASFICALLSKEIALMLPVVLIFYDAVFKGRIKNMLRYLPYAVIVIIYVILRTTVLDFEYPVAAVPEGVGFYERILTFFKVFMEYLRLLIMPFNLHMERVLVFSKSLFRPEVLFPATVLAIVLVIMLAVKKRHKLIFFGLGWFFITLFPLSNIPFALNATLAEHWLYIPSMGIAMVAGSLLAESSKALFPGNKVALNSAAAILSICAVVYFSVLTVKQNAVWRDSETLYNYTLKYAGNSSRLHYNLGNTYRESGRLQEAEKEYKMAIQIDPSFYSAYFNMGLTYAKIGDFDNAIAAFEKSLTLKPNSYKAHAALGLACKNKGMLDEAIKHYNKALESNSNCAEAYNYLGDAYFHLERYQEAETEFRKALAIDTEYTDAWNNLGVSLIMQKKIKEAIAAWEKSLRIEPDQPQILDYLRRNVK